MSEKPNTKDLSDRILILEQASGKLDGSALTDVAKVLFPMLAIVTGALGLFVENRVAPTRSVADNAEKDIARIELALQELKRINERQDEIIASNHKLMIDRTEALQAEIAKTVSEEVIEQRFRSADDADEALEGAMLRIVEDRLQPQINRNRVDTEDNENKIEEMVRFLTEGNIK